MHDWREYVRRRLPVTGVRPERENEIVAELGLQMEQAHADAIASGASEQEALARATAQFADWKGLAREIERAEDRGARWWTGAGGDFRTAARQLWRNPLFAAVAIVTLAFGIGGNTAIFTIGDTLVLRGLPYREPGRLMAIETRRAGQPEIDPFTSAPAFFDLRARARSFESLMAIQPVWNMVLTGRGDAEQVLPDARRAADAGPLVRRRRGRPAEAPAGGAGFLRALAAPSRRQAGRPGAEACDGRRRL
jgi:hypothetical protein